MGLQGWRCENASFGFGFYFEIISLVCFVLAIAAAWMGQYSMLAIDPQNGIENTDLKSPKMS